MLVYKAPSEYLLWIEAFNVQVGIIGSTVSSAGGPEFKPNDIYTGENILEVQLSAIFFHIWNSTSFVIV